MPTRREHLLYSLGAVGVVLHAVDHLVTGHAWDFWFTMAILLSGVTAAVAFAYRWLSPGWRAAFAVPLGLMWAAVAGVHHVGGLFVGGAAPTDDSGIAAAIGGVLMVVAGWQARSTI